MQRFNNSVHSNTLEVKVYNKTLQVSFTGCRITSGKPTARGCITAFSQKSKRNMKLQLEETADQFVNHIRLTYPGDFPCDGRVVARDRRAILKRFDRRGIKYHWVLEFQERGAPHLHVMVDHDIPKDDLSRWWFDIVGSGNNDHLKYGSRIERIRSKDRVASYMLGYLKKDEQKAVPEGYTSVGRFWGSNIKVSPKSIHVKKFQDERSRARFFRPVRKWYERRLRSWGQNSGKRYKMRNADRGLTMWGGASVWDQYLMWLSQQADKSVSARRMQK